MCLSLSFGDLPKIRVITWMGKLTLGVDISVLCD